MDAHVDAQRVLAREKAVADLTSEVLVAGQVRAHVRRQRRLERKVLAALLAAERLLARVDAPVPHQIRRLPVQPRKIGRHRQKTTTNTTATTKNDRFSTNQSLSKNKNNF